MHSDGTSYQFQTQNGLCFPPPGMGSRWCRKRKVPWRIAVEVELCLGRSPDPDSALTNAGDPTRDTENCRTRLCLRAFGGHQTSLDKAYWCSQCEQYVCYDHARKSVMVNTMKCPKGHEITKA